jgi:predicted transcriptional regulator
MVLLDERILELFSEEDEEFMSPSEIAGHKRIPYSSQYVGERCRKLANNGLLRAVGNGVYTVTDDGLAYLNGEFDAAGNEVDASDEATTGDNMDEA